MTQRYCLFDDLQQKISTWSNSITIQTTL